MPTVAICITYELVLNKKKLFQIVGGSSKGTSASHNFRLMLCFKTMTFLGQTKLLNHYTCSVFLENSIRIIFHLFNFYYLNHKKNILIRLFYNKSSLTILKLFYLTICSPNNLTYCPYSIYS